MLKKTRAVVTSLVFAGVLLGATPARSHHSNVAYEVTKVITITGVVKEFRWVNPHTWLTSSLTTARAGRSSGPPKAARQACFSEPAGRGARSRRARR